MFLSCERYANAMATMLKFLAISKVLLTGACTRSGATDRSQIMTTSCGSSAQALSGLHKPLNFHLLVADDLLPTPFSLGD